jgi:hypothetical protein
MQIVTIEAQSKELRLVGHAAAALFGISHDGSQPTQRSMRDYGINRRGIQLPVWPVLPPREGRLSIASLSEQPRLSCCSLLVRIMTVAEAKTCRCSLLHGLLLISCTL